MSELFNEDYLVQDASYSKVMNETVLPWLQEKERASVVSGFEGRPLYCVSYSAEKPAATVLIVHGFTENAFKYAELIWSLLHLGFSVIAYDQRGHGRSWRAEGLPTPSVTHVDRFSDYVSDLKCVCDTFLPQATAPFFLFAHSMGGAVASLFMEHYPGVFSAAVLSCEEAKGGWVSLKRAWRPGDEVALDLAMPVRILRANDGVAADAGLIAPLKKFPVRSFFSPLTRISAYFPDRRKNLSSGSRMVIMNLSAVPVMRFSVLSTPCFFPGGIGSSLETSQGRERKQQHEYDETVAAIPETEAELEQILPLCEEAKEEVKALKEERKTLRKEKKELESSESSESEEVTDHE